MDVCMNESMVVDGASFSFQRVYKHSCTTLLSSSSKI